MATTDAHRGNGLIRGLRDRLPWRTDQREHADIDTANIVKRVGRGTVDWAPLGMMRDVLRGTFRIASVPVRDRGTWVPPCEIRETAASIRVIADVPGVRRDALDISLSGNRLIVTGERQAAPHAKGENLHACERHFGRFTRTFTLPESTDFDHITSELRDGVLTIIAPFKDGHRSRKIEIAEHHVVS
jgi:HSP20 family protein